MLHSTPKQVDAFELIDHTPSGNSDFREHYFGTD